jgi:hypothetical protein
MSNIDDYFMWKTISAAALIIFGIIYLKLSLFKKYGTTGLGIGLVLIIVLINFAQWRAGYISPIPRVSLVPLY